jgi:hypothetical protein
MTSPLPSTGPDDVIFGSITFGDLNPFDAFYFYPTTPAYMGASPRMRGVRSYVKISDTEAARSRDGVSFPVTAMTPVTEILWRNHD